MAGCFSNVDREDRAMEKDLFRFLAAQADSTAEEAVTADLMGKAVSLEYAQNIAFDYECMQGKLPELIAAACEAHATVEGMAIFSARSWVYEQLGRQIVKMVESEMSRIAAFQENCDA